MKIFIEADSIATDKMSGIGHTTLEIIKTLDNKLNGTPHSLIAIVPYGCKNFIIKHGWKNVRARQLPPGYKYVNYLLVRTSLPIPVDLWFGRGVYIFPNYKNWYVPFSRSVMFIHDVAYKLYPHTTHPKNLIYLNANMDRWLKRANVIVSISRQSAREVESVLPAASGRVKTVYLGVDRSVFSPRAAGEIERVLAEYGLGQDYFLVVGNVEPRKNLPTVLDAYKKYADKTSSPAQLVIVGGDGWNNDPILHKLNQLKQQGYDICRPKKYVEDAALPALYSGTRALVHVAIHEGFGLPPLQAQACGARVIVSNIPVMRETLTDESTVYVEPLDTDALTEALIDAPESRPGRRAHPKANLTWENTVTQLMSVAGIIDKDHE